MLKVINSGGTARNYNRAPIVVMLGAKKIHILSVPIKQKSPVAEALGDKKEGQNVIFEI